MTTSIIIGGIGVAVMLILLFLRMWIPAAMLTVGFVGFAVIRGFDTALGLLGSIPFAEATFYALTTLPVFIFMGQILMDANIGKDLYETAYAWFGHLRGGLVMATVPACAAFGAVTGIPTPASVTMGKVALPEMRKFGYQDSFSSASITAAATLAMMIPPSIPMIVYGLITQTDIGKLFIAGILPGICLAILFMIQISIRLKINPKLGPAGPKSSWRTRFSSLRLTWPVALLFVLVMGALYTGVVTATQAGSLGAVGALIIAAGIMRRLKFKTFLHSLREATGLSAVILFLIIGAQLFARFLAISGAGSWLVTTVVELHLPVWGIFAVLIGVYIILGCLLDVMSAVIITMPVVFPAIVMMGFDPVWFGVIIMLIVQMGVLTPPVGLDVFIFSGATGVPIGTVFRGIWPYVLTVVIFCAILYAFPQIALLLPSGMG
jgi:C4-dicarboxylate transporter DctM subunit